MRDEFIHLIPDSLLRRPGCAFQLMQARLQRALWLYVLLLNPAASAPPQSLALSVCSANETFADHEPNFTP